MQENKYFVPSIEDIRVGYECEINRGIMPGISEGYEKVVLKDFTTIQIYSNYGNVFRTPYLTKEQIEAEAWLVDSIIDFKNDSIYTFTKSLYSLDFSVKNKELLIYKPINYETDGFDDQFFKGHCPSINEFRYITNKLLKI